MRAKALLIALAVTLACTAKDIKTVVLNTAPEMHCSSCENKIKSNIRFEKGVKDIVTNLADKTVTVTYDADKTDVDKIIEGFKKIDYVATIATPKAEGAPQAEQKKGGCCGSGGCKCGSAKKPEQAKAKPAKKKECCCGSKKALLTGVDGVTDVAVNLESKIVTVNYDSQKTDAAKIQDSFKQINYTVEEVH